MSTTAGAPLLGNVGPQPAVVQDLATATLDDYFRGFLLDGQLVRIKHNPYTHVYVQDTSSMTAFFNLQRADVVAHLLALMGEQWTRDAPQGLLLNHAIRTYNDDALRVLLEHGVCMTYKIVPTHNHPLVAAAKNHNYVAVKMLVAAGVVDHLAAAGWMDDYWRALEALCDPEAHPRFLNSNLRPLDEEEAAEAWQTLWAERERVWDNHGVLDVMTTTGVGKLFFPSCLRTTAAMGSVRMFDMVFAAGEGVFSRDRLVSEVVSDRTLLRRAAEGGSVAVLQRLHACGADLKTDVTFGDAFQEMWHPTMGVLLCPCLWPCLCVLLAKVNANATPLVQIAQAKGHTQAVQWLQGLRAQSTPPQSTQMPRP